MATTRLIPLHINKGKTIATTLSELTDYANNPEKTIERSAAYAANPRKTKGGELVRCFACDPHAVDEDFMVTKRKYDDGVGRVQRSNIIAYHLRQSFKPGEIEPREALEVGYELAYRFTKGKHAFIVAVHTDKAHVHCHIVFNSTTLDATRKFRNFLGSAFVVRRLSDLICAEHGLSVIKEPKPSKGQRYDTWLGVKKKPSFSDIIRQKIDDILPSSATFDDIISALKSAGFIVYETRKYLSVLAPGQKRPIRLNTLGGDYTEAAIRARLSDVKIIAGSSGSGTHTRISLLVDIQAKIREGKGAGYEQWAKIFNLNQAAKTLIFLQENGIDSYDDLKKKSSSASGEFALLTTKIKDAETRLKEITELQKNIGQYGKTRDVYAKYKASGWSRKYYDEHTGDIILHRAAKKFFDGLGAKKLPSINQLKQEWATLSAEKKKLYTSYYEVKENSRALSVAKANADRILGHTKEAQNRAVPHAQKRHDINDK